MITDVTIAYTLFLSSALIALWAFVELIIGGFEPIKIDGECRVCGGQNGHHSSWCGHA